jgi:hypothetical protein
MPRVREVADRGGGRRGGGRRGGGRRGGGRRGGGRRVWRPREEEETAGGKMRAEH